MEIKFPEQENPFPKTLANFIVCCTVALLIGLFLGNALGAFFGTDETVLNTSNYADRMSATRTMFTDADQLDSFVQTALLFQDMEGLKLYTSKERDQVLAYWDGEYVDAFSLFDNDTRLSLIELMNTEDALYGQETTAGEAIDDIYLRNVAVVDGIVYYYLYYDDAGFIGLAYAPGVDLSDLTSALALTQTSEGAYEWYIIYDLGD